MFVLTTISDVVRISPEAFDDDTLTNAHLEIDKKYPNRVIMDLGLVICRYGPAIKITQGQCVAGDPYAHHQALFRLIVFRPFVEEVCLGKILHSSSEGITVSVGFFSDIFIPAYWMLRPSQYDDNTGLWVWTPDYDEEEDDDNQGDNDNDNNNDDDKEEKEENKFEMDIGSEIRFKVKAINFTRVTNTAKGVQATTTTTSSLVIPNMSAQSSASGTNTDNDGRPLRKRSSSVDLTDAKHIPASMQIIASICEDGLGLTSWWTNDGGEEEEEEEE